MVRTCVRAMLSELEVLIFQNDMPLLNRCVQIATDASRVATLTSHLAASKVREYARCGPADTARAPRNPCTPLGYSDKTISPYTFCFLELCFKLMWE